MQLLELLQGGEIAIQGPGVGLAADTWKTRILIVGPAIRYGAAGWRGVAEGVGQMRELICNAIRLQIGDVVAGAIDAPFLEVAADHFRFVIRFLIVVRFIGESGTRKKEGNQQTG